MMDDDARGLTLYEIEFDLDSLIAEREDAETDEERAALDEAIGAYVHEELRKVDNLVAYIANQQAAAEAAHAEAQRLEKLARVRANRATRLKDMVLRIMQETGKKRLEGRIGTLLVKGNGGVEPLVIENEQLLPVQVCKYEVTIPAHQWRDMLAVVRLAYANDGWTPDGTANMRPNNQAIREALKAGPVPGARLDPHGVHLEVR